jgi:hypothetical protein
MDQHLSFLSVHHLSRVDMAGKHQIADIEPD